MATRRNLKHSADVRARIKLSQLVTRLHAIAMGQIKATIVQVRAIEVLLRKTLPDLHVVDLHADLIHRHVDPTSLSDAELAAIAIAGRSAATEAPPMPEQPPRVVH
jgi:hypothetical protein